MITETLYIGRNNTFSLQLLRDAETVNLMALISYSLHLSNGRVFSDQSAFTEKDDGVLEINIGGLLTEEDLGIHKAYLVSIDLVNTDGIRWPNFKLRVLE